MDITKNEQEILDRPKKEIETLQRDELPAKLVRALEKGKVIIAGQILQLDGQNNFSELLQSYFDRVANEIYTEFDCAAVKFEKDEHILSILTWKGGTYLQFIQN